MKIERKPLVTRVSSVEALFKDKKEKQTVTRVHEVKGKLFDKKI